MLLHDAAPQLLVHALAGNEAALHALFVRVAPIIHARVSRALVRRSRASARDPRQELGDMMQEVFVSLLSDGGRALRAWNADRGLSLENFVGLVAERQVASILRTGKRNPWRDEPVEDDALARHAGESEDGTRTLSRDTLLALLSRLETQLTPRMQRIFHALWVEERSIAEVCEETAMQPDAVYAARSRIAKRARNILANLEAGTPSSGASAGSARG